MLDDCRVPFNVCPEDMPDDYRTHFNAFPEGMPDYSPALSNAIPDDGTEDNYDEIAVAGRFLVTP